MELFVTLLFLLLFHRVISEAGCDDSGKTFTSRIESACLSVENRKQDTGLANNISITTLHVNPACAGNTEVELELTVAGHVECSQQAMLFVLKNNSECHWKHACTGQDLVTTISNVTLCLIKCPKTKNEDNKLEVELLQEVSQSAWNLGGLKIHDACSALWTPPVNWTIAETPAVYRNFDQYNCLKLNNGANIVAGKSNNGVKTIRSQTQWVSLGNLSLFTCFPRPWTCGPEGATLSVWLKIEGCGNKDIGYITSRNTDGFNGFLIRCLNDKLRFLMGVKDGLFRRDDFVIPDGWFHVTWVFHGPSQGFTVYHADAEYSDKELKPRAFQNTLGTVVIGRRLTKSDKDYGSVTVDELMFWNRELNKEEAQMLRNM